MATFGPLQVDELIEVQAFCEGPGGSVFSDSVFVSTDCDTTVACAITSDPNGSTGPAGTPVNLAGSATGAFQYQMSFTPAGPWVVATPPTSITAGSGTTYWRICCVDNPLVCSNVTVVSETVSNLRLENPWDLTAAEYTEFESLSMTQINALPGQDPEYCALGLDDVAQDVVNADNGPGPGGQGQFRFFAAVSHYLPDDPIVFPNQPGGSHLHMFFGNTNTDAFSTCNTLLNSGAATVQGGAGANRTAYWFPALFDGPKGGSGAQRNIIVPSRILIYYKSHVPGDLDPSMIPNCLELIGGNIADGTTGMIHDMQLTQYLERAQWGFYSPAAGSIVESQFNIPTSNPNGWQHIRAALQFPQCIEMVGGNPVLSSTNHLDHQHILQSPGGGGNQTSPCPSSHPYRIPQVSVFLDFEWPADGDTTQWRLSSDIGADSDTIAPHPGESLHGDIVFAWNECVEQAWYDGCMDPLLAHNGPRNCSGGQTGSNGLTPPRALDRIDGPLITNQVYTGPNEFPDVWDL